MNLEKVTVARADGQGQVGHFMSPSADTYLQLNVNVELNRTYTLHGYIKSVANGTLSCLGKSVGTTASWNHFSMQIVPDSKIFSLVFSPGEYWFYNFKLEKGTIMTQWTPNGEDLVVVKQNIVSMGSSINQLNDKITQKVWMTEVNAAKGEVNAHLTNVEQTANKIDWLVKSGTDASNMTLTDNTYSLITKNIDLKGNATFSSFLDTNKTYINGGKIATGSITADQIAADAITADKIAAKTITSVEIAANAITADKISADAITSAKIAADAITADKIATDAIKSKNYIANTSGSYLNLADGTFDSKNLQWDSQGNVTVKDGTISGATIKGGTISGMSGAFVESFSVSAENPVLLEYSTHTAGAESSSIYLNSGYVRISGTSSMTYIDTNITLDGTSNPCIFFAGEDITGACLQHTGDGEITCQAGAGFKVTDDGGTGYAMHGWDNGAHKYMCWWDDSALHFYVDSTNIWTSSDRRLKKDITQIKNAYIEAIGRVDLVQYRLNRPGYHDNNIHFGAIAQDIIHEFDNEGIPSDNLKMIFKDRIQINNSTLYYGMDYEQFLILRVAYDEQKISKLETRLDILERQLSSLQNQISSQGLAIQQQSLDNQL